VILQVSLSVVLLIGAGLFVRNVQKIWAVSPGFNSERVLLASFNLYPLGYPEDKALRFYVELIEAGLHSKEAEKQRFFALANRLSESTDSNERQQIKKELARMTFGE